MPWGLTTPRIVRPVPPFHAIGGSAPGGAGLVGSVYPVTTDDFVPIAPFGHYHVATDYDRLNAAIQNIQAELGLNPAGSSGTIASRLFYRRNNAGPKASGTAYGAGWRRLRYGFSVQQTNRFLATLPSAVIDVSPGPVSGGPDFSGVDNGWGDGIPLMFISPARETNALGQLWYTTGAFRLALVETGLSQLRYTMIGQRRDGADPGSGDTTNVYITFLAINWSLPPS